MQSNWRTTTLGSLTIAGILIHRVIQLLNGQMPTMADVTADSTGITLGWGLIHAADAAGK